MGFELTAPGNTVQPRPTTINFTHIQLTRLYFEFPPAIISARITWLRGELDGSGAFVPLDAVESVVPTATVVAWLQQTNTDARKNWEKLEDAMFNYLVSAGEITAGTVVELP